MLSSNRVLLQVITSGAYATPPPDPEAPKFLCAGVALTDVAKAMPLSLDLERPGPWTGAEARIFTALLYCCEEWPEEVELGLLRRMSVAQ